jgi:hypothetical protein
MSRKTYNAGEIFLYLRHVEKWIRSDDLHYLSIIISDAALTAACDGINGEVELQPLEASWWMPGWMHWPLP